MFAEIIKHTPIWVFGLFFVLIYFGIQQSKNRVVPKLRLAILPAVMIGLSLSGVLSAFGANILAFTAWLAALILVLLVSKQIKPDHHITFSSVTQKFNVPGSWLPLGLMMAIFMAKYAVAIAMGFQPSLSQSIHFIVVVSFVYGFLSSIFFARAWRVWATQKKPVMIESNCAVNQSLI
jgi:hypothetical protein